ncbi:hypothetical protein E3Q00_03502 [Wallemia mellicola]|nr:hypothetical protein E3Q00_03502 [Wallemia mellicola]
MHALNFVTLVSEDYEPVDKKGKGREVSSASAFLGVMNKPLSTPGVEIDDVGVPQHIENLVEHGREEQLIKGAVTDEPVETEEHVDEGRNTVNEQTIEVKNSNEYESIVEDEHIANKPGIAQAQDTNVNDEINDKIPGNDEPVIATTEESAPISEETSRSDNTKNSISERMAKISMAGGFKFGPVPPIPARPVQREAEDEEVEETHQVEKEDVAPEEPVENVHEVKEDVAQPEEAQPEEQPEETDAERRSRIAKKLAASGALRPVLGGDPAPAVPAVQPHNEEEVHEEDGNEVEEVDNDAMKDVADNVQKDLKSDNTSNVGDSITQEKEVRDDEDEPSPPPVPSRDFTNAQDDKRKSIPMPSRELPSLGTAEQPSGDEKKEVIESEPEVEENEDAPPPMPTRSSIVSPPAPVRSVPDLPQAPPARAMPAPPPISTNFESTESKSVETSPVLASPPARVVPAPPSATDTSPPRPPIPKKRTSISSQHSTHRSSIGSVLDHNIPPIPRSPSIKNSPIEQHQRSSIASSIEVPAFPEVPQTVETEEDADSAAERRRHITERLAASGGIRPLVGGLPQPPSRSIPQPDTSGETPEPTEELSEKPETVVDEENPESEAERRARIAKKLAMQGSIRPIFGSVEEQPKEEKAQDESEEEAKQSGSPVMEVEEQPHLETSPQQSLPPPIPKQRPRSFIVPATSIPPPKSPPPTSPPPNPPPPAPPSRQLPRLQSPPSPQSSKHDEVTDEDRRDSTEFVKVPSSSLSVTTPQAERESFEFVASPKDKGIPPSPRSPGKSPIGPRPVGKHIYTHEELVQLAQQVGKKIHEFTKAQYELSKNMPIADGTAIGFVTETLALCNAANDPVNWNFGHLVHAQTTQGLAKRLDDPRPGDVLVLRHAEFKGRKALGNYKASFGAHGPQVAFVTEYDLKKGKVTAIQTSGTPNNYPSLEYISIKFGDLKEGSFEIFRPVPLS